MNTRLISVFLSLLSALGVSYIALDTLLGFGSIEQLTMDMRIFVTALIVTLVPIAIGWAGVWWVSQSKTMHGYSLKLLGSSALAWAFLFFGSIFLALQRFT